VLFLIRVLHTVHVVQNDLQLGRSAPTAVLLTVGRLLFAVIHLRHECGVAPAGADMDCAAACGVPT
jgi:hypothetical protein